MKSYFVSFLLFFATTASAVDDSNFSPKRSQDLLKAVESGRSDLVEKLLKPAFLRRAADPNVSQYDYDGFFQGLHHVTPILLAAKNVDLRTLYILLDAGANPLIFDMRSHVLFSLIENIEALESDQVRFLELLYPRLKNRYAPIKIYGTKGVGAGHLFETALKAQRFSFAQRLLTLDPSLQIDSTDFNTAITNDAPLHFLEILAKRVSLDEIDTHALSWVLSDRFCHYKNSDYTRSVLEILTQNDSERLPTLASGTPLGVFASVLSSDSTFRWLMGFLDVGIEKGWWPVKAVQNSLKHQGRMILLKEYKELLKEKGIKI